MRADFNTPAACTALIGEIFQGSDVFQMSESHIFSPYILVKTPATNAARPRNTDMSIRGTAVLISLTTPERDVTVLAPVKFIARKAEIAGSTNR